MARIVSKKRRRTSSAYRAILQEIKSFFQFYGSILTAAFLFAKERLFSATLPITKRILSRKPFPPGVKVNDIRANRIKLELKPRLSSPFNVETYEISFAHVPKTDPSELNWQTVSRNDMTWRTVARLKGDETYQFRVRSYNDKGVSSWSAPTIATTKLEPVEGGAHGPGYTWNQTDTEVSISIEVPDGTQKKAVHVNLEPEYLQIKLHNGAKQQQFTLLEGKLPHRVRNWENGSYWELLKDNGKSVLCVTLEKEHRAISVKFDYWRSFFVGHPEIDTHKIPVEESGRSQFIQPQSIPASHLAAYGLNA